MRCFDFYMLWETTTLNDLGAVMVFLAARPLIEYDVAIKKPQQSKCLQKTKQHHDDDDDDEEMLWPKGSYSCDAGVDPCPLGPNMEKELKEE